MRVVDLVQIGAIAVGKYGIGTLYAQLVHDYLTGQSLPDRAYGRFLSASARTVGSYFETLERWGLVTREGSTRSRKFVLGPTVNAQFCEDVLVGMYGAQVIDDLKAGTITCRIAEVGGKGNPVCDYAVQQLLGVYGVQTVVPHALAEPSTRTGTGSVVFPDYRNFSSLLFNLNTYSNYVQIKTYGEFAEMELLTYSVDLPDDLVLDKKITSPKERAGRKKVYTLPKSSWAFSKPGWTLDRIREVDVDRWADVVAVLTTWNDRFKHEEKLDAFRYAVIRSLLCEESIPLDTVKRAIQAASVDTWWKDRAELKSFLREPQRVRQFAKRSTHDRLGRNMDVHPKGEVIAVEF